MASIFGSTAATPSTVLLQMKAGKMAQNGTTVTPDTRKGLMVLRKTEDGLMHLIWQDRASGTVEDDLIVFQGDATLKHVPQCKTGFAMMLSFTTGRKVLFWSQESRKKGLDWEDVTKETELVKKANDILDGTPAPAAAAPTAVGFGGMTHSELMTMLSGGAAASAGAPPAAAAPAEADAAAAAAASAEAPASSAAAPAASTAFSPDAIASLLSGIPPAAAAPAATPAASSAAPAAFSPDAIANLLSGMQPAAQQVAPLSLNAVLAPEATVPLVDGDMERRLAEHLPGEGRTASESVRETLTTPQMAQAAARLGEALHSGDAAGLVLELGLDPNYAGLGVEPFLRALQEATRQTEADDKEDKDKDGPQPMEE